ncbi:MAG: O-antigen ligase family protein [Burkholderiales bacterium]|nr:O-antigen ligase family protein [Burkholderiales bacterium]
MTIALIVLLALLPFGDAGRTVPSWAMNAVAFGTLLLLRELIALRPGAQPGVPIKRLLRPGALFIVVVLFCYLQTVAVPAIVGHPVWTVAAETLGGAISARLSIDPDATSLATLRLITAACAFWIAAQLAAHVARALILLYAVVAIGTATTILGLWDAASAGTLRGVSSVALIDVAAEAFGNRNVFATYVGMASIVALALLWRRFQIPHERSGSTSRLVVLALLRGINGMGSVLIGATCLLLAAVMASGSRGAILSTCLSAVVLSVLMLGRRHHGERRRNVAIMILSLAGFVAAVLAFGDVVLWRLAKVGLYDQSRMALAETTLTAIGSSPWFGYGYGTFGAVFPMFRDDPATIWNSWSSAHNIYLETAAELGIPVAVMLAGAVGWIVWECLRGAQARRRYRALPAAAASVAVLGFVHAAVDFSLAVQAVNLTFATILGVGFAQAVRREEGASIRRESTPEDNWRVASARNRIG